MKIPGISFKYQIATLLLLSLATIWAVALYEIFRSHGTALREAEVRTTIEAQVFAEYSRSTLKRVNEFILNTRSAWTGDWEIFSAQVKRSQENIDDISFQVAVIDQDGLLAFSNLAKPTDRTDLSQREHFRVHKEAGNADRLFISKPLLGKVSGKWSIQMTRPILKDGQFAGVLVVSISPDQFASFATKLRIKPSNAMTIVRNSGEIMARYPSKEDTLGIVLKDRPFLGDEAPVSGSYRLASSIDGTDRIWGYYRLPEYGLSFVMGEALDDILAPHRSHRLMVILGATGVSLLAILLFFWLFRSHAAMEEAKRQLDEIFVLSPDGFVSFDEKHRVKYASPAFTRMTGFDATQLANIDELTFSTRLAAACADHARFPGFDTLREHAAHPAGNPARQLIEMAGPQERVLEVGLCLSTAATVSQILYCRDVTRETEVDRMKSEFVSTAAHELRTPMASIYGFSEILLLQEVDDATRRELLETIYRQAEGMASIINELLDLARIEARRGKDFVFVDAALAEMVEEALSGYKVPTGRSSPQLGTAIPAGVIKADRKKIAQAIVNLLSNAYKYSPQGGEVSVDYVATDAAHPGMVGVRIIDQGIGMTPEQAARVFERFYRADTSGKIPGSGLGMSIVKEIVELHHGQIEVDSRYGGGTAVTLWLPLLRQS